MSSREPEEVFGLRNWLDFLLNRAEFEVLQTVCKVSGDQVQGSVIFYSSFPKLDTSYEKKNCFHHRYFDNPCLD